MFIPRDTKIPVVYYRLRSDSDEYKQAQSIHEEICAFVKAAQVYADSKGADSWRGTVDNTAYYEQEKEMGEWAGYRIGALRYFDEDKAPDDWVMNRFGDFKPALKTGFITSVTAVNKAESEAFLAIKAPVRQLRVSEGFDVRFHVLNDQIIVATPPNKDGTRPRIAAAEPLEESVLAVIKLEAKPQELAGWSLDWLSSSPIDQAAALHKKALTEDMEMALREVEDKRFIKNASRGGTYVPNPTTGLRGLLRVAFG